MLAGAGLSAPAGQCVVTQLVGRVDEAALDLCLGAPRLAIGAEITVSFDVATGRISSVVRGRVFEENTASGSEAGEATFFRTLECTFDDASLLPGATNCPCVVQHVHSDRDVVFTAQFQIGPDEVCGPFEYVPGTASLSLQLVSCTLSCISFFCKLS